MELLSFYYTSIIASILLIIVLGFLGHHLIGRGQSLEVLLLGQEFQTAILFSAFILSVLPHINYNHNGIHLEVVLTLFFTILSHFIFKKIFKNKVYLKTEGVVGFIIVLMGLNQLIILASPLIEMHMVKSYIGDIVTVSKTESFFLIIISLISSFCIIKKKSIFFEDTLEISLFGKLTKKRKSLISFNILTVIMMLFSIHHFGVLFTLGTIILPGLVNSFFKLSTKDIIYQLILSSSSPIFAFAITTYNDQLPTTVVILFIILAINLSYGFIKIKFKKF